MANDVSYFKVSGDSTTYQFNDPDAENRIGALESTVNDQAGDIADNTTAINANASAIGTLSNLTTSAKGSLVAAINEVDSHADTNASAISQLISNVATNTGNISTLKAITAGIYGSAFVSAGSASTINLTFSGNAVFLLLGLNRRASGGPCAGVVRKYNGTSNYAVLSGTAGSFTTSSTSAGMTVTMPDTYYDALIIGSARVAASV